MERATLAILAGGKSRRFGEDKALVKINGATVTEEMVHKCASLFDEILICGSGSPKFSIPGIREIGDIYCDAGPMGGLHAALSCARNDTLFIMACDMPFFSVELAEHILAEGEGCPLCLPCAEGKAEPLFAMYRREVLPMVTELLETGKLSMLRLLDYPGAKLLECSQWLSSKNCRHAFYNMNFKADFEKIRSPLARKGMTDLQK